MLTNAFEVMGRLIQDLTDSNKNLQEKAPLPLMKKELVDKLKRKISEQKEQSPVSLSPNGMEKPDYNSAKR